MRYHFDHDSAQSVTTDDRAFICPFAQTDVMMTLMKGVAPDLFEVIDSQHEKSMQKVKDDIIEQLTEANVSQDVIDKVVTNFSLNITIDIFKSKVMQEYSNMDSLYLFTKKI